MKDEFLKLTNVKVEADAMCNSISAALQHNPTYLAKSSALDKKEFRETLANQIKKFAVNYYKQISEDIHNENIKKICNNVSNMHGQILINSRLRFGTVQKAFNLYLKFLWRLDQNRANPPHCPVDRTILSEAKINGSWTKLDSVDQYMSWIRQLRQVAQRSGFDSLQQWELSIWNNKNS